MNTLHVKIKNRDEIIFIQCYYQQQNNFILVKTIDGSHEVGAFNLNIIEYVYFDYEEIEKDKNDWSVNSEAYNQALKYVKDEE